MDRVLELNKNGVVVIENAISKCELNRLRAVYNSNWQEIKEQQVGLEWKRMIFNSSVQMRTGAFGKNIYDGKLVARYPKDGCNGIETQVIDMGNGRFDFTHGFQDMHLEAPDVDEIMKECLVGEYNSYLGALPILEDGCGRMDGMGGSGVWHRDAYSLFDDESIDMQLKPFYYTILIPLDDLALDQETGGRTTEFILGSHRVNLVKEHGIRNAADLDAWCNHTNRVRCQLRCKAGDVCIFHGYLVHRGIDTVLGIGNGKKTRLCYAVYKKNWYEDEPEGNYILEARN